MDDELDFASSAFEGDRIEMLRDAATRIDDQLGHLGSGSGGAESREGAQTRGFIDDVARLPGYPDIYRITQASFVSHNEHAPVPMRQLFADYDFYWMRFAVGLAPQVDWGFNRIEVRIEFEGDGPAHRAPKAFRILPEKRFQELLRAHASLSFQLNEDLEFEAKSGPMEMAVAPATLKANAGAAGSLKADAGATFGRFEYGVKKAKIDHSAPGLEWVFWRLDGAEFFQEDSPELIVVAQMPKALAAGRVKARLQASRYFRFGAAPWQKAIAQVPAAMRRFFEDGMPLADEKDWDISPSLR